MLELVVGDDAIPELVAGLVDGDAFRLRHPARRQPPRACREERRVLHAPRAALISGIDYGDMAIGIRAEPLAVIAQGGACRLEVAIFLSQMLALE